jgi:hypothetical protein
LLDFSGIWVSYLVKMIRFLRDTCIICFFFCCSWFHLILWSRHESKWNFGLKLSCIYGVVHAFRSCFVLWRGVHMPVVICHFADLQGKWRSCFGLIGWVCGVPQDLEKRFLYINLMRLFRRSVSFCLPRSQCVTISSFYLEWSPWPISLLALLPCLATDWVLLSTFTIPHLSHVANVLPQQIYSKVTGHGSVVPQITQGVKRVSREWVDVRPQNWHSPLVPNISQMQPQHPPENKKKKNWRSTVCWMDLARWSR